jgi:hypothetical protein
LLALPFAGALAARFCALPLFSATGAEDALEGSAAEDGAGEFTSAAL